MNHFHFILFDSNNMYVDSNIILFVFSILAIFIILTKCTPCSNKREHYKDKIFSPPNLYRCAGSPATYPGLMDDFRTVYVGGGMNHYNALNGY